MEKTIKISEETHKSLTEQGNKSETYDQIIMRLIKNSGDKNGRSKNT